MKISNIGVQHLCIPFTDSFQHASASRNRGDSVLVTVFTDQGTVGYGEGCPRDYVTGESSYAAAGFIHRVAQSIINDIHEFADLVDWVWDNEKIIDENPAAWCALELAVIDAMAKGLYIPVESMPGFTAPANRSFRYSAVIGAGSLADLERYLSAYHRLEFTDFKIKLCGDVDIDRRRIEHFAATTTRGRLRLDANNLWPDPHSAARYLEQLPDVFFAIEEPLAARDLAGLERLLALTNKQLILDESFTCREDTRWLLEHGQRCIANIRVSKMGGLIRARKLVDLFEAKQQPYIVGAHVGESSLLTRAAMLVGHDDSQCLVAREGAAGEYLLRSDICRHPLSFSRGGICKYVERSAGLGCEVKTETLSRYAKILPASPVPVKTGGMSTWLWRVSGRPG